MESWFSQLWPFNPRRLCLSLSLGLSCSVQGCSQTKIFHFRRNFTSKHLAPQTQPNSQYGLIVRVACVFGLYFLIIIYLFILPFYIFPFLLEPACWSLWMLFTPAAFFTITPTHHFCRFFSAVEFHNVAEAPGRGWEVSIGGGRP